MAGNKPAAPNIDFSKVSDADLESMAMGKGPKSSGVDLSKMSDDELQSLASGKIPDTIGAQAPSGSMFGPGGSVPQWLDKHPNVKTLTKGFLEQAPYAGGAIGALGGGAAGVIEGAPTGFLASPALALLQASGGMALGAGIGKTVENIGKNALLGETRSTKDLFLDPVKSTVEGSLAFMGGKAIDEGIRLIPQGGRWVIQKIAGPGGTEAAKTVLTAPNVAQAMAVEKAGKVLGVKPTAGMKSTNMVVRGLENSLEQSPTMAGEIIRKEIEPVRRAMNQVVEGATAGKTVKTAEQVGEAIKEGMRDKVLKTYGPIQQIYKEFEASAQNIPVKEKSLLAIVKNISTYANESLAGPEQALVNSYGNTILGAKNVDQLKQIRTSVISKIRNGVPSEQMALSPIVEKLDRAIKSNTLRASLEVAQQSGLKGAARQELADTGKQLIGSFKTVSKDYRDFISGLSGVAKGTGVSKKIYGPMDFVDQIESIPSSQLGDKIFKENNFKLLGEVKSMFPQEFEMVRQQKLADIFKQSLVRTPDGLESVNPDKFLKAINRFEPEVRGLIFGPEFKGGVSPEDAFSALKTLTLSVPSKVGPSGTPQGMQFLNMATQPRQEIAEAARLKLYRGLSVPGQSGAQGMTPPVGKSIMVNKLENGIKEVSAAERHAETATERRLRMLREKTRNKNSNTGN